jgi:hypothetical protein
MTIFRPGPMWSFFALAGGSRRAETNEDLARCEASQSCGDSRNAQPLPPLPPSKDSDNHG